MSDIKRREKKLLCNDVAHFIWLFYIKLFYFKYHHEYGDHGAVYYSNNCTKIYQTISNNENGLKWIIYILLYFDQF